MKNCISTTHTTSNEAGEEEVRIEYEQPRTFFQWLFNIPKDENITEVYIGSSTVWYAKRSGLRASSTKELEILDVIERLRQMKVYGEDK